MTAYARDSFSNNRYRNPAMKFMPWQQSKLLLTMAQVFRMLFRLSEEIFLRLLNDLFTSTSMASETLLVNSVKDYCLQLSYSISIKFLSIFKIFSHNVFLLYFNLSYEALSSDYFKTSGFNKSLKSLHKAKILNSVSSESINFIVMPTICILSENPNDLSLLPLLYKDHMSCSFSVNIEEVFFWLEINSVKSK